VLAVLVGRCPSRHSGFSGLNKPSRVDRARAMAGRPTGKACCAAELGLHPDGRDCGDVGDYSSPASRACWTSGNSSRRRRSRAARGAVDRPLAQWDSCGVATLGEQRGSWTRSLLRRVDEAQVAGHVDGARFCPLRPTGPAQFL
jgi:hypothetical protein